jgi:integrase
VGEELSALADSADCQEARDLDRLVTFQVMRRTLGTDLQKHGSLKDAQGALRHASIKTTGDVYVQTIEESVLNAMNSRTMVFLPAGSTLPSSMAAQ